MAEGMVNLQINYDDEKNLFVFNYQEEFEGKKRTIFLISMPFFQFEALSIDMMSIVKNFNLQQARNYQTSQDVTNAPNRVEDGEADIKRLEGPSEQSQNALEEEPSRTKEELSEVSLL